MIKTVGILAMASIATIAANEKDNSITLFTAIDVGRVEKGYDVVKEFDSEGTAMNRTYVDVGFQRQLDDRYLINIGVGGIFWKAYETGGGLAEDKVIKFGPGISNAYMKVNYTENLDLTFGYFGYKYNASAKNLGEYLFRSEAYPTIIYTGGWSWMNDVQYHTVGLKLTHRAFDGKLTQDLGIFGEYFNAPIYDMSPAYIATYKPSQAFTLGGAISLHRFITPTPKVRETLTREYTYRKDFYIPPAQAKTRYNVAIENFAGNGTYNIEYTPGTQPNLDSLRNAIFASEQAILAVYNINSAAAIPLRQDTSSFVNSPGVAEERVTMLESDLIQRARAEQRDSATYFGYAKNASSVAQTVSFDLSAIKLVAFFNLDFNAILGLEEQSMGAFNLYGEVAQLGLKDYPIFYTDAAARRPMMLGFSIPTFGLLNHLSFEVEYLKNPVIASIASTYDKLDLAPDENYRYEIFTKDDTKWSMHASRNLSNFMSLFLQVANDHMRLKDGYARPQYIPVTNEPSHWYWLVRLQWVI